MLSPVIPPLVVARSHLGIPLVSYLIPRSSTIASHLHTSSRTYFYTSPFFRGRARRPGVSAGSTTRPSPTQPPLFIHYPYIYTHPLTPLPPRAHRPLYHVPAIRAATSTRCERPLPLPRSQPHACIYANVVFSTFHCIVYSIGS
ncbi:hypothetical protein C8Q73DRAFT_182671 [Cubamyces lactineus]|nr:hypothetical protein C8Q73DRAFT_182671 [Cubamyces lactineus]